MIDPAEATRHLLEAERARALAQADALRRNFDALVAASDSSNADDEHDPEGATIAFERAQLAAQIAGAEERLVQVERAVARARSGAYGSCEVCRAEIPAARLEARPSAATCVACAGRSSAGG